MFGVAVVYLENVEALVQPLEIAQDYLLADVLVVVIPRGVAEDLFDIALREVGFGQTPPFRAVGAVAEGELRAFGELRALDVGNQRDGAFFAVDLEDQPRVRGVEVYRPAAVRALSVEGVVAVQLAA